MRFAYSGGTGSPKDWIGVYKHGQTPGLIASTVWQYVPTTTGQVEFAGTLAPGTYDVHLFCCDGYNILASYTDFKITPIRLRSRLTYYKASDILRFQASDVAVGDQIRIYHASDFAEGNVLPNAVVLAEQIISDVNAGADAAITIESFDLTGQFTAVLLSGAQIIGFDSFEIKPNPVMPGVITRIGTGSCGYQENAQPTLEHILKHEIDFFLYMGDNLYIDTYDANVMRAFYERFMTYRTEFQQLRASVPLLATWDDHDYGCCDEDKDYPIKAQSQQIFLDFFEEPANSPRRTQEGIYTVYTFGDPGKRLQVILLDTRYFLDNKRPNNGCGINDYCPWDAPGDTSKTMLGDAQWAWLKTVLQEPADLRLVATSVQFSSSYHGFESWRLFPGQRRKFQELIKETHAEHLFFISGDMHYSEVSKLDNDPALYPLYDFTSSAINQSWSPEGNQNRIPGMVYGDPNTGLIEIDWQNQTLTFTTIDDANTVRFKHAVPFSDMEFEVNTTLETSRDNHLPFQQIPSPGRGTATLAFEKKTTGTITLYDLNGQTLRILSVENAKSVEIGDLAAGMYVAAFRNERGTSTIKVLIK